MSQHIAVVTRGASGIGLHATNAPALDTPTEAGQ